MSVSSIQRISLLGLLLGLSFAFGRDAMVLNPGFESPVASGKNAVDPIAWLPASGRPMAYQWASIAGGESADQGTQALLAGGPFAARTQVLEEVLAPGITYTLSAAFAKRQFPSAEWGGYWLRIDAVEVTTGQAHVLANEYGNEVTPAWTRRSLQLTTPSDLRKLGTIRDGITGREPSLGAVDFSTGTWKLRILVGTAIQYQREATRQAGIDSVQFSAE